MENQKKGIDKICTILIFLIFIIYYGHNYLEIGISGVGEIKIYQIIILLLTVVIMVKLLITKKVPTNNMRHFGWFFLFMLYTIFSLFWTIDTNYSISAIIQLAFDLLIIFDFTIYIRTQKDFQKVIFMYVLACIYMCLRLIIFETGSPGTSYFGNIVGLYFNSIAIALAFAILFSFYLFKKTKKKYWILVIVLFYYIIFLTGSRKGLLMPVIFLGATLIFNTGRNINKIIKNMMILLTISIVCISVIVSNPKLNKRIGDLFYSFIGGDVEDISINEREYYRNTALQVFLDNPILGIGVNGFAGYMAKIGYNHVAYAHNNWVELLSTLGIVGFIIYYSQYYYIAKKSLKLLDSNNIDTIIPLVVIVTLFIFEYGLVSYYSFYVQIQIFFVYMFTYFNLQNYQDKEEINLISKMEEGN